MRTAEMRGKEDDPKANLSLPRVLSRLSNRKQNVVMRKIFNFKNEQRLSRSNQNEENSTDSKKVTGEDIRKGAPGFQHNETTEESKKPLTESTKKESSSKSSPATNH